MMDIFKLIAASVKQNASDLHLSAGNLAVARIDGELHTLGDTPLDGAGLENQLLGALSDRQLRQFNRDLHLDYALSVGDSCRVRCNLFRQRRGIAAALRYIPLLPPELAAIDPPDIFQRLVTSDGGLVIISGATGSGKSTTLAALIQAVSRQRRRHIITLEDPIEFIYTSGGGLIQQREVGVHVASFEQGLHDALREDPDIILIGELRRPETIALALTAAETGHLVLATLHASSATQGIARLTDVFSGGEKSFIRSQLANNLLAIVTQQLLPRPAGGRVAAFEVLVNTPAVGNLLREGKTHQIYSLLQTGRRDGMQTLAQSVAHRRESGLI